MLPLTTTTVTIERWSLDFPGERDTLAEGVAGVVGNVTGREIYAYKGLAPSGWDTMLDAKANLPIIPLTYNDLLTDDATGLVYRVLWATPRIGLGLDHLECGLSTYRTTGVYSIFRGHTTDAYGDDVPVRTPIWTGIEGEVKEQERSAQEDGTGQPGTVRTVSGRFPPGLDIKPQDLIIEETTAVAFSVLSTGMITPTPTSDEGVELRKITT